MFCCKFKPIFLSLLLFLLFSCANGSFTPSTSTDTRFIFPAPTGKYFVGTSSEYYVDKGRSRRPIMVQFWYPAVMKNKASQYVTNTLYAPEIMELFAEDLKKKGVQNTEALKRIAIHSANDMIPSMEVLGKKYPVILFSHGYGMHRRANTANCEELASHGYVVIGIDHTNRAKLVVMPDGTRFSLPPSARIEQVQKDYSQDVKFVLDQINSLQDNIGASASNSKLIQRINSILDLNHIGIFGHSRGGQTILHMLDADDRLRAGVSLDGLPSSKSEAKKFKKPFIKNPLC
ncbi:MAG: hypothetical protein HQK53_17045 [Oligoflexia bacterium]|nr:hypothetical protein [Oligoflexia bacterium]